MNNRIKELEKKYRDAVYKESSVREASYLDITEDICGVVVKQLTPYHYLLLDFTGNAFLCGKVPNETDIVNLLWVISVEFKANDLKAKEEFIRTKCVNLEYEEVATRIAEFLQDQSIDMLDAFMPEGVKQNEKMVPKHCWVTQFVDTIASEYGWMDNYIIHLPFTRLLQYVKLIESRKYHEKGNTGEVFANYSEKILYQIRQEVKREQDIKEGKI